MKKSRTTNRRKDDNRRKIEGRARQQDSQRKDRDDKGSNEGSRE